MHAGSPAGRDGFYRQQTVVKTFVIQGDSVGEEGSFRRDVIHVVNGTALGRETPAARGCDPSKQPRARSESQMPTASASTMLSETAHKISGENLNNAVVPGIWYP